MKEKIKRFFKKYWKLLLTIIILVVIGGVVALVLNLTGVTDMTQLRVMFEGIGWWKYPAFVLVQIFFDFVLSFFPFTTMGFIALGFILFPWYINFILCALATLGISFIMYALGRKWGYKIGNKLIGEDEMNKAKNFLNTRGTVYLPVMFIFPFFPDDALCLVAGASKMKFWYFSLCTIICRPIGILTWCIMFLIFGEIISVTDIINSIIINMGLAPGLVIIITILLVLLMTVYHLVRVIKSLANKVDIYFMKKKEEKNNKIDKN